MTKVFVRTLIGSLLLGFGSVSSAANSSAVIKRLDKASAFLATKKVMRLDVEKTTVSEILNKTTESKGEIFLGGGKFRWETTTPEKGLIVFDGKTLWTSQEAPAELGGPAQVTKSTLNGKAKDQILLKILSGGKISTNFRLLESEKNEEGTVLKMEPKKADASVKNFSLLMGGKPERLREIRYTDDIGNLTKIRILKNEDVKKPAADLFKFEAPKGAEVNEL